MFEYPQYIFIEKIWKSFPKLSGSTLTSFLLGRLFVDTFMYIENCVSVILTG